MSENETESEEVWLPTTEQILMASERAILAALDANLLLASRALRAEHAASLGERTIGEPGPPQVALTECILILAASLHELIASYRDATGRLLCDD